MASQKISRIGYENEMSLLCDDAHTRFNFFLV